MKRVLVIAYYWPPSGGSGVQRWVKFVKYLPAEGWEPVVFAPLNADYPSLDPSFEAEVPASVEVLRGRIWEPYAAYRKLLGGKDASTTARQERYFICNYNLASIMSRGRTPFTS